MTIPALAPRIAALTTTVVLALALTACHSSADPTASPTESSGAGHTFVENSEPDAVAGCLQPGDSALTLDAPGVPTEAIAYGDGERGVILAHQSGQGPCAWDEFGRELAADGYTVIIPMLTAEPAPLLQAAADWLLDEGVENYALLGASMGGAFVLAAGGGLDPAPTAVIALSPPTEHGEVDALAGIPDIPTPVLIAAAEDDEDFAGAARTLTAAQPDAELLIVPGSAHGIALLGADDAVAAAVRGALAG
ncbi:alpha/beta hydrolase [Schumannella luteola]